LFDCNGDYPGFRSRYGPALLSPDPDKDPSGWLQFMRELAARMGGKPVLIASADQFVSAIALHEAQLREHYRLSPGVELQGRLATKETQYALAVDYGMPLPRTQRVSTLQEATAFASAAAFPCLMKPLHFREWHAFEEGHALSHQKVSIAATPTELIENWRLATAVNHLVMMQEIIEGPDTDKRVYIAVYDGRGRRIGNAMFRELRCDPIGFGPASISEPIVDDEADELCN
jgi:predicted ATP-grasp superfamily ATP-dependent carboligase